MIGITTGGSIDNELYTHLFPVTMNPLTLAEMSRLAYKSHDNPPGKSRDASLSLHAETHLPVPERSHQL